MGARATRTATWLAHPKSLAETLFGQTDMDIATSRRVVFPTADRKMDLA